MLHRYREGDKVGVDSCKIVDADRRHDPCPGGTPVPPGERGRDPPPLLLLPWPPPRREESSPSGPWPPWRWRGGSPSEIGSPSLFSSVSRSPRSGRKTFLIFREIRNSDCAEILTRFFPDISFLAPEVELQPMFDEDPPPRARGLWRALVSCGLCGPLLAVIPTPENHIYSKIILREILLHLDFV